MNVKNFLFGLVGFVGMSVAQSGEFSTFAEMYKSISPSLKTPISRLSANQYNELASLITREKDLCMKWIDKETTIKNYRTNTADCLYKTSILVLAIDRAEKGDSKYGNTIEKIYNAMLKEAEINSKTIPSGVKEAIASSVFVIYAPAIARISRDKWKEGLSDDEYRNFFIREYEKFVRHKMPQDLLDKLKVN